MILFTIILGLGMLTTPAHGHVPSAPVKLSFAERATLCTHPISKKLFTIMAGKQTNLAVSADVTTKQQLLTLADAVGPYICMLKTHIDIINDFDWDLVEQLQALADKHNFLIFEDRKFADIGNTVTHQYTQGVHRIVEWAHITNAHTVSGPSVIEGLYAGLNDHTKNQRGLLLLAQMSSKENLISAEYTQKTIQLAHHYSDFVIGFICQEQLSNDPCMIHITPGVHLSKSGDDLKQQYNTPAYAIGTLGTDIIIVGRGIYQAFDQAQAAKQYRDIAWQAYLDSLPPFDK
ncbi:MAG TPA: orotidine-5'-phosphate decarboxylase [Candidatus Dependentiae bacterium]|nr:orotidine-5'-phosphate decarboxylase [Candidatus Dependentiae bacterium]HRQ62555.1 orotidine-5'-phosphate decarboxylase [Candidatus Dependentiae bacterium]